MNAIHAKRVTIQQKDSRLARRYYSRLSGSNTDWMNLKT